MPRILSCILASMDVDLSEPAPFGDSYVYSFLHLLVTRAVNGAATIENLVEAGDEVSPLEVIAMDSCRNARRTRAVAKAAGINLAAPDGLRQLSRYIAQAKSVVRQERRISALVEAEGEIPDFEALERLLDPKQRTKVTNIRSLHARILRRSNMDCISYLQALLDHRRDQDVAELEHLFCAHCDPHSAQGRFGFYSTTGDKLINHECSGLWRTKKSELLEPAFWGCRETARHLFKAVDPHLILSDTASCCMFEYWKAVEKSFVSLEDGAEVELFESGRLCI
jgi:hypothetical protein